MDAALEFLETEYFGISLLALGIALVSIAAGFVAGRVAEVVLGGLAKRTPENTVRRAVVSAFERPVGWTLRITGIWLALAGMPLEKIEAFNLALFVDRAFQAATVVTATWLGTRLIQGLCDLWQLHAEKTEGRFDDQLVQITRKTGKVFLIAAGAVIVLQTLGYTASSLLAGLGIGGAALAFASKDTVANFFGSIVIFIDRPFHIGDWVEVGEVEGTVEEVGLRVTRIRTFANSVITIPNARFTTTSINNWSRMRKRRIKITIGLTYNTTPDKMRQAVEAIRTVIRNDDRLHQDFYLVNFFDFGPSSLDIFCYLFTRTTNWAEHMQIREDFMLRIMEAMQGLGLDFAFPTQTVHLEGLGQLPSANVKPSPLTQAAPKAMLRDTPI